MDADVKQFGESLAQRAMARNWVGVRELLAPWLQRAWNEERIRAFFEDEYASVLKGSEITELHYPAGEPHIGGNTFVNATSLREKKDYEKNARDVAPELNDASVRYWMNIQLTCSDEQQGELELDYLAEIWALIVTTPEGLRVGYWEPEGFVYR